MAARIDRPAHFADHEPGDRQAFWRIGVLVRINQSYCDFGADRDRPFHDLQRISHPFGRCRLSQPLEPRRHVSKWTARFSPFIPDGCLCVCWHRTCGTDSGETKDPEKVIPKAINNIPVRVLLFYIGALLVIMSIYPWNVINPNESPFVQVLQRSASLRLQASSILWC